MSHPSILGTIIVLLARIAGVDIKATKLRDCLHINQAPVLPLDVIKHVKPIYAELSLENLLSKRLHGKTQNQNESFNALIWERLPTSTYFSMTQLKFGSYDAVEHFNIGKKKALF